ncbi:hypothetical protein [Streptomyces sp. NPDC018693]|uniref:hypothetical protein n=1 Tax=unclassified Streptomyces TaxID=2593676 RepID=UPI003795CEFD
MTDRTSAPWPRDPEQPESKAPKVPEPEPEPLGSEVPGADTGGPGMRGSEKPGPGMGGAGTRGSEMRGGGEMRGPGAGQTPPGPEVRGSMGRETTEGRDALGLSDQEESPHAPLLPRDESDRLTTRLQHAVAEFVDHPREAVEEADHVLEELTTRVSDAMSNRRRTLRGSWQLADTGEDRTEPTAETEQLRLVLQDYRELTERLLHV